MNINYDSTLNLPKTDFPMRGSLPESEPKWLTYWGRENIYEKLGQKNADKPRYIVHNGPPYANGNIHMGHALNQILKDMVVRYKNMTGYSSPYVPGWDTHGLPTELKARAKAGVTGDSFIGDIELRNICKEFVLGYIDDQREQFKRLGILAEWENPYITLDKDYEATQIEVFAEMADKGHIYRGLKPVYWCPDCKTALAEAEIEYQNDKCYSVYVKFAITDDKGKLKKLGVDVKKAYFLIWTTTTWTLPGNVAVCVGPRYEYSVVKSRGEYYIVAKDLCDEVMETAEMSNDYEVVGTIRGSELEYMKVEHPFLKRESLVIVGEHVTVESGTGCVHTAPGHGVEDFEVCRNYKEIEIVVPVDTNGKLTKEAGQFEGLSTGEAGKAIAAHLSEKGLLFASKRISHQYPHCWRCKEPVLFRATDQWFCSIEALKSTAIDEIKKVKWIPTWGEDRMLSMVRERKDWCISRQRKWGVPIPIFFCKECGEPLIDKEAMLKVASLFREKGSDAWFTHSASEILKESTSCKKCGSHMFIKETDIMDVWFDSGVSHKAVCKARTNLTWPADLYFEGADQYRGWFQSSLLTSVAVSGKSPYKTVITHGWVIDEEGKKQSKSAGNGMEPGLIVKKYGADILRLWVSSSDYHADVRISNDILKQMSETYRKIRNTARYILGNLYDFRPDRDQLDANNLEELDKWALNRLNNLISKVTKSYESFEFHGVYHAINNFCVVEMSNFYLDIIKDRLYVERADSKTRRAAQTAIYSILSALTRLLAPILAFTSEEIWAHMPHSDCEDKASVLLNQMPNKIELCGIDDEFIRFWDQIHAIREDAKKALETARAEKTIGSSLEAKVRLHCSGELYEFTKPLESRLAEILIVSEVEVTADGIGRHSGEEVKGLSITVDRARGEKCKRCWTYSESIGKEVEGICERCAKCLG